MTLGDTQDTGGYTGHTWHLLIHVTFLGIHDIAEKKTVGDDSANNATYSILTNINLENVMYKLN